MQHRQIVWFEASAHMLMIILKLSGRTLTSFAISQQSITSFTRTEKRPVSIETFLITTTDIFCTFIDIYKDCRLMCYKLYFSYFYIYVLRSTGNIVYQVYLQTPDFCTQFLIYVFSFWFLSCCTYEIHSFRIVVYAYKNKNLIYLCAVLTVQNTSVSNVQYCSRSSILPRCYNNCITTYYLKQNNGNFLDLLD